MRLADHHRNCSQLNPLSQNFPNSEDATANKDSHPLPAEVWGLVADCMSNAELWRVRTVNHSLHACALDRYCREVCVGYGSRGFTTLGALERKMVQLQDPRISHRVRSIFIVNHAEAEPGFHPYLKWNFPFFPNVLAAALLRRAAAQNTYESRMNKGNPVRRSILEAFEGFRNVQILHLDYRYSHNSCSYITYAWSSFSANLVEISIEINNKAAPLHVVAGDIPGHVRCPKLKTYSLKFRSVWSSSPAPPPTQEAFRLLAQIASGAELDQLTIELCPYSLDEFLAPSNFPSLLRLKCIPSISQPCILGFLNSHLGTLREVTLGPNIVVDAPDTSHLEKLVMGGEMFSINWDAMLRQFQHNSQKLRHLDLTPGNTGQRPFAIGRDLNQALVFFQAISHIPSLEELKINVLNLSVRVMVMMATSLPRLKRLCIMTLGQLMSRKYGMFPTPWKVNDVSEGWQDFMAEVEEHAGDFSAWELTSLFIREPGCWDEYVCRSLMAVFSDKIPGCRVHRF